MLMAQPHLYNQGRLSQVYKPHSFWINMSDALYQSVVIFFLAAQVSRNARDILGIVSKRFSHDLNGR